MNPLTWMLSALKGGWMIKMKKKIEKTHGAKSFAEQMNQADTLDPVFPPA